MNFIVISLNLLFCFTNCLSQFILESQLNELKESVKHLVTNTKNISRVPHDCTDRPFVEIDLVFKQDNTNGSKYYAVYANQSYYVEIDGISRDHLPIIHRSIQPKPVDSRFRRLMTGKHSISQYKFVGPLYLYKIPNERDKYSLAGFNQVWLGCPQPLCISPGFDGILSMNSMSSGMSHHRHNSNMMIMFRGNYFWYYDFATDKPPIHPPLTDLANRVEDRWVDRSGMTYRGRHSLHGNSETYLNDSMVVPTYIDAIVPGINKYNNCLYFFKDDQFICYEYFSKLSSPLKTANEWKSSDERWKSAKLDAAFHIKSLIYFIAGDLLWCFGSDRISCVSYPKNLRELHRDFPMNISSTFVQNDYIYVVKGSLYYKIAVSRFPTKMNSQDMEAKYLFQDLLGCDEGLYTAWGFETYDKFIEKIAKPMQTGLDLLTISANRSESHIGTTFALICLSIVGIGSLAMVLIWFLKPVWATKLIQTIKSPFS